MTTFYWFANSADIFNIAEPLWHAFCFINTRRKRCVCVKSELWYRNNSDEFQQPWIQRILQEINTTNYKANFDKPRHKVKWTFRIQTASAAEVLNLLLSHTVRRCIPFRIREEFFFMIRSNLWKIKTSRVGTSRLVILWAPSSEHAPSRQPLTQLAAFVSHNPS